ncbi:hypothetical protein RJ639_037676 [Escallonia herrerae]|uniref:Pentatricopeptide repeat-containing protein n=1 Tax=Escallonia herrerae TaxID=1293975 RepID=A0AA88X0M4_9ASTE|nr:hypothetical protein RJ639_037676 [Escallonia herrerae]
MIIPPSQRKAKSKLPTFAIPLYKFNNRTPQSYHTFCSRRPPTNPRHERPDIPFVTHIKKTQDPDEALSLFHKYHQMGSKHDYPSYSSLIYKLARARNFEPIETLLHSIRTYNVRCRESLFVALIQHYGKSNLPRKAIELFSTMRSYNCTRGMERARQVFDEMLEREVEPSVVTYNCQIGFLCKNGEIDKAKGLFAEMVRKGKHPNAVTFALLMEGYCNLGKYKEAKKMMFDMEYQGCNVRLVNYGVLMSDLGRRGKIDEAKDLILEMKKRRFKPDTVMYNIMINYLCKEGRTAEAYKVLVEMQVGGCEPNAATYRMIVDGFCSLGEYEDGLKVLNAMLMSRHCPRLETFCCLIVGLIGSGKINDACFMLEEMEKRKMRLDLESWKALVRDACGGDSGVTELVTELVSAY